MDLFIFLFLGLIVLLSFFYARTNPNVLSNMLIGFILFGIALNVFVDGLSVPNAGVSFSGSTATFLSTNYSMSNPWIFALFWMFLVSGFAVIGITIGLLASGRVLPNGSIR